MKLAYPEIRAWIEDVPAVKIVHFITGLQLGGAEMVLLQLVEGMDQSRFSNHVVSLDSDGPLKERLEGAGATVTCLGGNLRSPATLMKVRRITRSERPHLVQTWMYHGDLFGGLGAKIGGSAPIVWGIHAGPLPPPGEKRLMKLGIRGLGFLSRWVPTRVVCCSRSSLEVHARNGYDRKRMLVIPNGFPLRSMVAVDSISVRESVGVAADAKVVGRFGRWHVQKDLRTMLRAFKELSGDPHLFLVGSGMDSGNSDLWAMIQGLGLTGRVQLFGEVGDPAPYYMACDVVVSSSGFGEAMPLVLGEAMSLGVPVVTTDVGDSGELVGSDSRVVPPANPVALASAIQRVLDLPSSERRSMGAGDQRRVQERFSIRKMVEAYERLYEGLLGS